MDIRELRERQNRANNPYYYAKNDRSEARGLFLLALIIVGILTLVCG